MKRTRPHNTAIGAPFRGLERTMIPFGAIRFLAKGVGGSQKKFYGSLIRLAAYSSMKKNKPLTKRDVFDICKDNLRSSFIKKLSPKK